MRVSERVKVADTAIYFVREARNEEQAVTEGVGEGVGAIRLRRDP